MAEIEMQKRLDSETYHAVKRMLPTADELREGLRDRHKERIENGS